MTDSFYAEGLRFECTRCSRCCRHSPGYVFLSLEDLSLMAAATKLAPRRFFELYCRKVDLYGISRISLREKDNFDCILWHDGGCSVYGARPLQCRSYPFWPANLDSPESWAAVMSDCPGAGVGRLHGAEEIQLWLELSADRRLLARAAEIP